MPTFYAHSTKSENKDDWQPLEVHLRNVANLAGTFASVFGAEDWGRICGLLHDAGKASNVFQLRLDGQPLRVDHSTYGARLAGLKCGPLGLLIAYSVAGHHGGIPDGGTQEGQLHYRLKNGNVPDDVEQVPGTHFPDELPLPFKLTRDRGGFSLSFFTRMIFSCLVDADFLDTESFCNPEKAHIRPATDSYSIFPDIKRRFDNLLAEKVHNSAPNRGEGKQSPPRVGAWIETW